MSDEQIQEVTPVETQSNGEIDALKNSIEALERKNHELIGKLKKAKSIPEDVNVQELLDFKRKAEQSRLESEGKYAEARQALEQQFREASAEKDKRIAELEARVRELELISPAVSALADIVHDPDWCLKPSCLLTKFSAKLMALLSLSMVTSAGLLRIGLNHHCPNGCKKHRNHKDLAHQQDVALVQFRPA